MKQLKVLFVTFLVILFIISVSALAMLAYWSRLTSTSLTYWPRILSFALSSTSSESATFLILGQDPRADQIETSQTTDTIILARYASGRFNALSLPRDLWDLNTQSRINRYYWNKLEAGLAGEPLWSSISADFLKTVGVYPQKHILITTSNLVDIFRLIGPVEVNLDYQFTDSQYPNPAYIKNPSPDIPIYTTVSFSKGKNIITADNVLPFVRSRKSSDDSTAGGTDLGRIERQQLVVSAVVQKIIQLPLSQKINLSSQLYRYFHRQISSTITDRDLALVLKILFQNPNFRFNFCTLPVYPDSASGVIYHPPTFINRAWVYLPLNDTYRSLHQFTQTCLNP